MLKEGSIIYKNAQCKSHLKSNTLDIQSILKSTKHLDSAYPIHKENRNIVIDILCIIERCKFYGFGGIHDDIGAKGRFLE
jgi:hypothetical protein